MNRASHGSGHGLAATRPRGRRWLPLLALCFLLLADGCEERPPQGQNAGADGALSGSAVERVSFCRSSNLLMQVVVAEDQGLFTAQGLEVGFRHFVLGRESLEAMLAGDCDFASAAEPPVIEYALRRDDFRILAALQNSENLNRIVARGDRGIQGPADLAGKRIATTKGTAPQYFAELLLAKHAVARQAVDWVFMKGEALLPALSRGEVDAIAVTNKTVFQAMDSLGSTARVLEDPGLYRNYYLLLARESVLRERPTVAGRLLSALLAAEEQIRQRPEAAKALAVQDQKVSPALMEQMWADVQHQVSLDHAMLLGLEESARWYLRQAGGSDGPVPNFTRLIDAEPLRRLRPAAVDLTR